MADGYWHRWSLGNGVEGYHLDCGLLVSVALDKKEGGWVLTVNRHVVGPTFKGLVQAQEFAEDHILNGARILGEAYRAIKARKDKRLRK